MNGPSNKLALIAQHLEGSGADAGAKPAKEYGIDELARAADTTVRNVRAYQDKGLLPPPRLRGRKGIYSGEHLARLRVITGLLNRGYTLTSIGDLFSALEGGVDLRNLIGLESAVTSPWTDEEPALVTMAEIARMFGNSLSPEAITKSIQLDLFRPEGDKVRVRSLRTLKAGGELVSTGIPLEDLLDIVQMLRGNVERVADALVGLVSEHVLGKYGDRALPPPEEYPQLAELIWRLRPLAEMAVHAELARAMEKAAGRILSDKLEKIIQQLDQSKK